MKASSVRPPHVEVKRVSAGDPAKRRTCPAVSFTAWLESGCSAVAPP